MRVRRVVPADLNAIMEIERQTFGPLGDDAMASAEVMTSRILLCDPGGWFWLAEHKGIPVGYIVLQPTALTPAGCTSWSAATGDGTMRDTFDENGRNIYVVSLGVSPQAPGGASELLAHAAFVQWLASGKNLFMFCSRVPGFVRSRKSIDEYWQLKHRDGGPRDPMMHYYWELTGGAEPVKLLKDGFPPDAESAGHGVLFAANDPAAALLATAELLRTVGVSHDATDPD